MAKYYQDSKGRNTFSIKEAKTIAADLNKTFSKFGTSFKVIRLNMMEAQIIKEIHEGGICQSKAKHKKRGV